MITRIAAGIAALLLFLVAFGGGICLVVVVGRAAWGWLFLLIPGLIVATIVLSRIAIRLMSRALDG